jgi:predicted phosphoribosyltransferase
MRFRDRHDAGRKLAERLAHHRGEDVVVIGMARGGVVVAYEVAVALDAPLDVMVVRKIGLPWQPEFAIGAVAPGVTVLREDVIKSAGIPKEVVERVASLEHGSMENDLRRYRGGLPAERIAGRTAILVDDGLATGTSAVAAIRSVRTEKPERVVLGEPVCAAQSADLLRGQADEVVCVLESDDLVSVGMWYEDFAQVEDDEVRRLVHLARERAAAHEAAAHHA